MNLLALAAILLGVLVLCALMFWLLKSKVGPALVGFAAGGILFWMAGQLQGTAGYETFLLLGVAVWAAALLILVGL